jgi:hypothetical protein
VQGSVTRHLLAALPLPCILLGGILIEIGAGVRW